jgi:NAD(P)-dependent dehydrogenase (short-subunit alcohol dehydrogenase family)
VAAPEPWDVAGRTCLVTGATSGIGRCVAEDLARRGADVLLVARDPAKGLTVLDGLRSAHPSARVDLLTCELSEMADVRKLAAAVLDARPRLDVLVNNAGVSKFERTLTSDGFETTFAVNHLAPFLLTNLLLERLTAAAEARVVTVSSEVHRQVKQVPWDDLQSEHEFKPLAVYQRSKLMNIWFTRELARRTAGTSVAANCLSPGFVNTGLAREAKGGFGLFTKLSRPFQASPREGADTVVHVATSPEISGQTGLYFKKRKPVAPSELAQDDRQARQLWMASACACDLEMV